MAAAASSVPVREFQDQLFRSIDTKFGRFARTNSCETVRQIASDYISGYAAHHRLNFFTADDQHRILTACKREIQALPESAERGRNRVYLADVAKASALAAIEEMEGDRVFLGDFQQNLYAAIDREFGRHATGGMCVCVKRLAQEEIGRVRDLELSKSQIREILQAVRSRVQELPTSGSGTFLSEPAKASAYRAIDSMQEEPFDPARFAREWRECMDTWDRGGRQRAQTMNGAIFASTLREIEEMRIIDRQLHIRMLEDTYYEPRPAPVMLEAQRHGDTVIELWDMSTFDAAERMIRERFNPLVLDMANKRDVGGAPDKASAQEETLCRMSNLYPALQKISRGERQYPFDISPGGIYVPHVQVFRRGPEQGYAFRDDMFYCSVYVSAAYNCDPSRTDRPATQLDYIDGMKQKMRDMFRTAHKEGHDSLLLGAFGCGAFRNDPRTVSRLYREVLAEPEFSGRFKKVVFAITDARGTQNLAAFRRTFASAPRDAVYAGGGGGGGGGGGAAAAADDTSPAYDDAPPAYDDAPPAYDEPQLAPAEADYSPVDVSFQSEADSAADVGSSQSLEGGSCTVS